MRPLVVMLALVAVASVGGTARAQSVLVETTTPDPVDSTKTVLEVRNERLDDMVVYVVYGGLPTELGVVHAMQKTTFTLPRSLTRARASMRFMVRRFGAQVTITSRDVLIEPGDHIQLRIVVA